MVVRNALRSGLLMLSLKDKGLENGALAGTA